MYIDLLTLLISFRGGEGGGNNNSALICVHSNLHIFSAPNLFLWIPPWEKDKNLRFFFFYSEHLQCTEKATFISMAGQAACVSDSNPAKY